MRIKKFYEIWSDEEEDDELSIEELQDRYREDLRNWPTSELYSMVSDIYFYVDDERFIDDYIDGQVDSAMEDFTGIFTLEDMQKFLSENEDDESLETLRDAMKEHLREEYGTGTCKMHDLMHDLGNRL